jgi:hypothetical protein
LYQNYLSSKVISERNLYYNAAIMNRTMHRTFSGIAIGVWAFKFATVYYKANRLKNNEQKIYKYSPYYTHQVTEQKSFSSFTIHIDSRSSYQKAIDSGNFHLNEMNNSENKIQNCKLAINFFESALKLKPNDNYALIKLNEANKILESEFQKQKIETAFNEKINQAEIQSTNENYIYAIQLYNEAIKIKNSEKSSIQLIIDKLYYLQNEKEKLIRNKKLYETYLNEGNLLLSNSNYDEAKEYFLLAYNLIGIDTKEAYNKLMEIENLIINKYPTNKWSDWETIYNDQDIKIEISFLITDESCNNGRQNKFKLKTFGNKGLQKQKLYWENIIEDCNGNKINQKYFLNLYEESNFQSYGIELNPISNGVKEDVNYRFAGKLHTPFYNIYVK